jgi:hypothetical protein
MFDAHTKSDTECADAQGEFGLPARNKAELEGKRAGTPNNIQIGAVVR